MSQLTIEQPNSGLDFGESPPITSPALLDIVPFGEPFDDCGPSSPSFRAPCTSPFIGSDDDAHTEVLRDVHPEVDLDLAFLDGGFTAGATSQSANPVPDVASADMDLDLDETLQRELSALDDPKTWPQASVKIDSPSVEPLVKLKREPSDTAVPTLTPAVAERPRRGPKSRTKVQEEIRDELDATIYELFPMSALKMSRDEFKAWREYSNVRKLSAAEQRRLSEIRRMLRARVFAERTRLRNIAESQNSGKTLSSLRAENARLKKKVATFEATQAKLQARIKKLLAEKRAGR